MALDLYGIDSEIEDWSRYGGDLYGATGAKPAAPLVNLINEVKEKIPDADQAGAVKFINWLHTRVEDAATGTLGAPRAIADMSTEAITAAGKFFGIGPRTSAYIARTLNTANPATALGQIMPSADELKKKVDTHLGDVRRTNAPESWGTTGKVIDAATTAAVTAPFAPGSVVRNVVPAIGGAVASELAGEATQGTWYHTPARMLAGLLGGVGTGIAQNAAGNVAQGVRNAVAPIGDAAADSRAARILGRATERDRLAQETLARTGHGDTLPPYESYLPGTPYAATAGENVQGVTRGAYVPQGPARTIINQGAEQFRNSAEDRIEPVIGNISRLPGADVRVPQLHGQAGRDASPLYRAAGVSDDPQAILLQGTDAAAPPTVTSNSTVLQSPDLLEYMKKSGPIKRAVAAAREDPDFADLPPGDMALVDKAYKRLGSMEAVAARQGDSAEVRSVRNQRETFLRMIEAENPEYAAALRAFSAPMVLADAARAGQAAAAKGVTADQMEAMMRALPSDAARLEFRGGYAGALRERAAATNRATDAERMYGTPRDRAKLELVMQPRGEGPTQYPQMDAHLMNEARAQRALRDITKGSTTVRSAHDAADVAAGDSASVMSDLMTKGATGTIFTRMLRGVGSGLERVAEGNTESVNAALARMAMETDPRQVSRYADIIERARAATQATAEARRRALAAGGGTGVLSGLLGQ